jgi:hypothetical protein
LGKREINFIRLQESLLNQRLPMSKFKSLFKILESTD